MRNVLVLGWVLGVGALAEGSPVPGMRPSTPAAEKAEEEAREFAHRLDNVVRQVSARYVRPVSREALLRAALAGLYREARRPAPAKLDEEVRRAVEESDKRRQVSAEPGLQVGLRAGADGDEVVELIRRARLEVWGAEGLKGSDPLLECCRALARQLDPHSGIVTAEEQRRNLGLDAEAEGYGLELRDNAGGPWVIRTVYPGGPAQKAGLRPGDTVVELDGKPAEGPGVLVALQGPSLKSEGPPDLEDGPRPAEAKPVRVTYRRPGEEGTREAVLRRERFRPETVLGVRREEGNRWDFWADRKARLAHVRLGPLGRGTAEELGKVLEQLEADDARGLVLDLRWCPGGFLDEAVSAADRFVGEGALATVQVRGEKDTVYESRAKGRGVGFPVVVLINGETRGGGELIAAALQDHGKGVVVGQRSQGKASVQTPMYLGLSGVGMKLTTGTFVRPSGKNLHRFADSKRWDDWGVRPKAEHEFRVTPGLSEALEGWWLLQTLRPGKSRERLPLDDPEKDAQALFALGVLRGLVPVTR